VIKFYTQVGDIKSKHKNDKSPLKGAWSGSHDLFYNFTSDISGMAEAGIVTFCRQVDYIKS